jgi:ABC-type nitrate/sulfonate/bicarbonate transport system substrate-binding protein
MNIKFVGLLLSYTFACAFVTSLAHAQEATPIDVALGDVSLNKVAFLVAEDNGIYKKYGLSIKQFITAQAADRIQRSGVTVPKEFIGSNERDANAPISIGGGSPLIYTMTTDARSVDRVIIATTDNSARFHIIASKEIAGVDDLKGKRLGYSVNGSVSHLMALAFLKQKKWSPESDISLMSEGMAYPALKDKKVDAFIGSEIYYTMASKNGAKDLVDLSEFNIPLAGSGVNVERKWFEKNKPQAQQFLQAMIEAYALMKNDKSVVQAALSKWYNITDAKQQNEMYAQVVTTPEKPYPAVDGIELVMQLFTHRELKRQKAAFFYDSSMIEQLDKSGFIDRVYARK